MGFINDVKLWLNSTGRGLAILGAEVQKNYQEQATPTPSFLREVQGLRLAGRGPAQSRPSLFSLEPLASGPWKTATELGLAAGPGFPFAMSSGLRLLMGLATIAEPPVLRGIDHLLSTDVADPTGHPEIARARLIKLGWLTSLERGRIEI